jgi:hypothetical protein
MADGSEEGLGSKRAVAPMMMMVVVVVVMMMLIMMMMMIPHIKNSFILETLHFELAYSHSNKTPALKHATK